MAPLDHETKAAALPDTAPSPRPAIELQQEMFQLGFASNAGTKCSASNTALPIEECVSQAIRDYLSKAVLLEYRRESEDATDDPKWTVVWGPGVAVIPLPHDQAEITIDGEQVKGPWATNVMFVARRDGAQEDTYFVSIAGTDSKSFFDSMEDFRAHVMLPWPFIADMPSDAVPLISLGFRKGLAVLEHMRPIEGMPGAGRTLDEYFAEVLRTSNKSIHVITGGHSQGGALSPLVALWLRDTQEKWDPNGRIGDRISSWPFAGPTPGNKAFANYYDMRVPLTFSVINPMDVATKFFNEQDLGEIPNLYSNPLNPDSDIRMGETLRKLLITVRELVKDGDYTRIPQDPAKVIKLSSTVVTSAYPPQPNTCCNFAFQMGYQHLYAYFFGLKLKKPEGLLINQFTALCGKDKPCNDSDQ